MKGWSGGRGSSWSYRQRTTGSNASSSRSGTVVSALSTTYTSSGSRFSAFSTEAVAMHYGSLEIHEEHDGDNNDDREEAEEQETEDERIEEEDEPIRGLVQEFFSAPAPAPGHALWLLVQETNGSIVKRGDMSAVERWLKQLGVGWVLSLNDGESAGEEKDLDRNAWTWMRALHQIEETIYLKSRLFPDRGSVDLPSICDEGGPVAEKCLPDRYHFALFIQETMLKMLVFVDVLGAWDPITIGEFRSRDWIMLPPCSKLCNQLGVHDALSAASNKILTLFELPTSVQVQRIANEMDILLSAYKSKLGEAIRSTIENTMAKFLEDANDSSIALNPQGSSDIHKVTLSVMKYIRFLWANYSSVDAAVSGKYVPHIENVRPLDSMIMEMVSCLQEKLANISQSISDQGLRFLFLLNNSYLIQNSQPPFYRFGLKPLNDQTKGHMERYLQVSWTPLLPYLFNSVPLCLGKNYSPLSKFESEFQKIYTTQKEWKVLDPWLRRELRRVIIDKIIPGYTEYINDNKATKPKISPLELEVMMQELFEG